MEKHSESLVRAKTIFQLAIKIVRDLEESLNLPLKANNFR